MSESTRLDAYSCDIFPELSRASVQKLIVEGKVRVNGTEQTKTGYKVKASDKVIIDYDPSDIPPIPIVDIPIIYEDDDCVVIDKPIGMLSHSKGAYNPEATVATWLKPKITDFESDERGGIVHRLDRATSGVMICAKNPESLKWLQKQFSMRKVKKTYLAIVEGELDTAEAIIDIPIERNPKQPQRFRAGINGKSAQTQYQVIRTFEYSNNAFSLLELSPKTGRTHQLRVHLDYIKKPIVGDDFYLGKSADRLYLHAHELEITLPNKIRMKFNSPIPPTFNKPRTL